MHKDYIQLACDQFFLKWFSKYGTITNEKLTNSKLKFECSTSKKLSKIVESCDLSLYNCTLCITTTYEKTKKLSLHTLISCYLNVT